MSVKQIALACSGPPLGSNMLNVCIVHVAYVSTLMSLQLHGRLAQINLVYNSTVLQV